MTVDTIPRPAAKAGKAATRARLRRRITDILGRASDDATDDGVRHRRARRRRRRGWRSPLTRRILLLNLAVLVIPVLGLMQTVVISRSLALKSRQAVNAQQDIVGQGLANLTAPFVSAFAGAGSFNRSAAHLQAGAKSPMAAVYSVLGLALLAYGGGASP